MCDRVLWNYLRVMFQMEKEYYTLEKIKEKYESDYKAKSRQLMSLTKETNMVIPEVHKKKVGFGYYIAIVFGAICIIEGLADLYNLLYAICCFFGGIFLLSIGTDKIREVIKDNERQEYSRDNAIKALEEAENKRKSEKKKVEEICCELQFQLTKLQPYLKEKEENRERMYSCNILHPKYRNFYCTGKIYDLLDTGICNGLTEVEGAYSQMRTDVIIDNQHITHDILNRIAVQNQMLYNAITQTNHRVDNILGQMYVHRGNDIQVLKDITNNSELAAFLKESVENDKKALAALPEYIAYAERERRRLGVY